MDPLLPDLLDIGPRFRMECLQAFQNLGGPSSFLTTGRSALQRFRSCLSIPISLIDQLSSLECDMRWILLLFGSLATGVLTIVLSLALLLVSLSIFLQRGLLFS